MFLTQPLGRRNPHVLEEHLIDLVCTVIGDDGGNRDTGRLQVQHQKSDAVLLLAASAGTEHAKQPV